MVKTKIFQSLGLVCLSVLITPFAQASPSCSVCREERVAGKLTLTCSAGQETKGGACLRLGVEKNPGNGVAETSQDLRALAVSNLKRSVEDAFNLCCRGVPLAGEKCDGLLAPIEGCHSASCKNCKTHLCDLCLEPQANSDLHSDDWEWKDGHTGLKPEQGVYTEVETYEIIEDHSMHKGQQRTRHVERPYTYKDRSDWQWIRRELETLFMKEKDERVKKEVLTQVKPLLQNKKIWPLPFAKENWIEKVMKDPKIDQRNKIALLQNEYIYQNRIATQSSSSSPLVAGKLDPISNQAKERAEAIAKQLTELKAPVLGSLDLLQYKGAEGEHVRAPLTQSGEPRSEFITVMKGPHGEKFGNYYRVRDPEKDPAKRVPDFTIGFMTPDRHEFEDVMDLCKDSAISGKGLPSLAQFEALGRAMTEGQPKGFNRDLVPELRDRGWVWTSHKAYGFQGGAIFHVPGRVAYGICLQ